VKLIIFASDVAWILLYSLDNFASNFAWIFCFPWASHNSHIVILIVRAKVPLSEKIWWICQ